VSDYEFLSSLIINLNTLTVNMIHHVKEVKEKGIILEQDRYENMFVLNMQNVKAEITSN